jgi:hypothetical protein
MNDVDPGTGLSEPPAQPLPRVRPDSPADMSPARMPKGHSVADSSACILIAALFSQRQRPYWGIAQQREQ